MDWLQNSGGHQTSDFRPQPSNEVSGIILAGGKGKRLGTPKALIEIGGESLILRTHRLLKSLFSEVLVVSGNSGFIPDIPEATIVADEVAGIGPIGGLITGLRNIKGERAFCVACDMPFLDIDLIQHLISLSDSRDAVVPCAGRQIEPLHAVYSRTCLEVAQERIKRRQYSLTGLILSLNAEYVHIPFGPRALSFFNINTLQDLALAERVYAQTERRPENYPLPQVLQ